MKNVQIHLTSGQIICATVTDAEHQANLRAIAEQGTGLLTVRNPDGPTQSVPWRQIVCITVPGG